MLRNKNRVSRHPDDDGQHPQAITVVPAHVSEDRIPDVHGTRQSKPQENHREPTNVSWVIAWTNAEPKEKRKRDEPKRDEEETKSAHQPSNIENSGTARCV